MLKEIYDTHAKMLADKKLLKQQKCKHPVKKIDYFGYFYICKKCNLTETNHVV